MVSTKSVGNTVQMNFRMTPELRRMAEEAAHRSGLTLPDWLRAVVARAANEGAYAPRKGGTRGKKGKAEG